MTLIVNTPALDYWRATTAVFSNYTDMLVELYGATQRNDDDEKWGFLQYKGDIRDGVGHGQALQGGEMNYMIDIPGKRSDELLEKLVFSDMKMTRLDLQFTVKKPVYWDSLEFYYCMDLGVWPGRKRHVTVTINDGNDTIYIGDRTSDRFVRVYVKNGDWVRFEVEFKRERAVAAWNRVRKSRRHAIAGILQAEMNQLPDYPMLGEMVADLQVMSGPVEIKLETVKSTNLKRVKWLASLLPTIRMMTRDHDYGDMVTGWFVDIIEERLNNEN